MNREIKFKRVFLRDDTGKFSHFSEWGVNINKADFVSPGNCNFAYASVDLQYTGLKDKNGEGIYCDDIIDIERHGLSTRHLIVWQDGGWQLKPPGPFPIQYLGCFKSTIIEKKGNIHESPDLLNA